MTSDLSLRHALPSDHGLANKLAAVLAQALRDEALAAYLTRHNPDASARLWLELLRLTLVAGSSGGGGATGGASSSSSMESSGSTASGGGSPGGGSASSSSSNSSSSRGERGQGRAQMYYLSDLSTAAVMQQWPEDRAGWHRHAVLLRLAKVAPWGKWRALREVLVALDRQKAAFFQAHGPFLYLVAIGTAAGARGRGLGSVLLDHLCRQADAQQRFVYVEASGEQQRGWLKRHGFFELLRHAVRPHAPAVVVMVRRPLPAGGGGGGGAEPTAGATQQRQLPGRPAGSVRTR